MPTPSVFHPFDSSGGFQLDLAFIDADSVGISDFEDSCPDSTTPESIPRRQLRTNRFALTDISDGFSFDTTKPNGNGPMASHTLEYPAGCSCEQIVAVQGLGMGHTQFGCSIDAVDDWVVLQAGL